MHKGRVWINMSYGTKQHKTGTFSQPNEMKEGKRSVKIEMSA